MSAEPRRAAVYLRISQDRKNRRLGVDRHGEDAEALIKAALPSSGGGERRAGVVMPG
ncbi:hypothetical protein JSY14_03655 [Brachybacterium sp. EF45031]|uniref:hypothetical protein n=1 Tax=Brachybacterium sillae TaxID=2810536 RepID=UPI00217CCE18|nr:hypothetical protein [Brachybacterium sillae]MCS6711153.1 hypothetical protein [Brachybacterium sillae]